MDALARGLRSAAAILEAGELDALVRERYASWGGELGRRIEAGEVGLEELEMVVVGGGRWGWGRGGGRGGAGCGVRQAGAGRGPLPHARVTGGGGGCL